MIASYEYGSLLPYCRTERQKEVITQLAESGTQNAAADALGIADRNIAYLVARVKKHAISRGWSPEHGWTKTVPEGYHVKGTTTLYDEDGKQRLQWVKTNRNAEEREAQWRALAEELAQEVEGKAKAAPAPAESDEDTLTVYPLGDPHIGLYSWHKETGQDFDCEIAEANLIHATERLTAGAPSSSRALIVNLGDFFHSDTQDNRTARSGHALDVDTRWARVQRVGVNALRGCISAALTRHQTVHVVNVIGNHDDHSAIALSLILEGYYSNEPRVVIDDAVSAYRRFRFGSVLLGMTHGHNSKPEDLAAIMAAEWPEEWGATRHRYWLTGHIHTRKVWECRGALVESFRTLAARDAWTASMGYSAGRDMQRITYHRDHGEVERQRVDIGMLAA